VVEADTEKYAIAVATARGINPGGEAMILPVNEDRMHLPIIQALKYRLLSADEMKAYGETEKGRPSDATYACDLCNTEIKK
jgi:hypothetical protein